MQLIDLSHQITENMPVYPGDQHTKIETGNIIQKDGCEDHYLSLGTHAGTHIDAPSHMILGAKTLDQFPLEKFTGKGVYIPVQNKRFDLSAISSVAIQEGDIVLFHTEMSARYDKPDYFSEYPSLPEELANYLIQKKVKMVGVDTCSVDHDELTAHKLLLQQDILILENLTNMKELKDKQFKISAFPLNLALDGSPTRVVAELQE
ncbi:MAG TPA: cyclase family protein [Candidatus Acidoferrales bacterium]|nr:cyclase family protein [Candidatus Acidoferrales bacterium]